MCMHSVRSWSRALCVVQELNEALEQMLSRGGLASRPPAVGRTFDFAELPAALDYLRSGKSVGKVVVTIEAEEG